MSRAPIAFFLCGVVACGGDSGNDVPTTSCTSSDCAVAASIDGLRWELPCGADLGGNVCAAADFPTKTTTLSGTAGTHYAVTLHFRGVVEEKTYTGGTTTGFFNAGGADDGDSFNVYALTVSSPAATYYLNAGTSNIYNCFAIDYSAVITMDAGATVTLAADPIDGHEIENLDASSRPIVVPDIAPAPDAYNGQFIQMDVTGVSRL